MGNNETDQTDSQPSQPLALPPPAVDHQIHSDDHCAKYQLNIVCECPRVEDGDDMADDEISFIGSCPALFAQPILQRRQRTDPAAELDEGPPNCSGQMEPDRVPPLQCQQSAEQDKQDKGKMHEENDVGQEESGVRPCRHRGSAFVSLSAPAQDQSRSGDVARCRAARF